MSSPRALDRYIHLGDMAVRQFLDDVESYFGNARRRSGRTQRTEKAVVATGDDVILLGHSLGSVVAYELLRERPSLPVRMLITLGSPLWSPDNTPPTARQSLPRWCGALGSISSIPRISLPVG